MENETVHQAPDVRGGVPIAPPETEAEPSAPEMIERVALAMQKAHGVISSRDPKFVYVRYSSAARAAIEAMREPTEAMIASFPRPDPKAPPVGKIDLYRAMIDAALTPAKQPA